MGVHTAGNFLKLYRQLCFRTFEYQCRDSAVISTILYTLNLRCDAGVSANIYYPAKRVGNTNAVSFQISTTHCTPLNCPLPIHAHRALRSPFQVLSLRHSGVTTFVVTPLTK